MPYLSLNYNHNWLFSLSADPEKLQTDYDDTAWRQITLPHDWSIEGRPSPDAPGYCRAAWLPNGSGVYRKHFTLPPEAANCTKCELVFDGIYRNAEVYVNGKKAGGRPWGYIPFRADITEMLVRDGGNTAAVLVDNTQMPGTRWYSGTGIYRDVRLNFYRHAFFTANSIQITSGEDEYTRLAYQIKNTLPERRKYITKIRIIAPDGTLSAESCKPHVIGAGLAAVIEEVFILPEHQLWSLESPQLYTLECVLKSEDGEVLDREQIRFGIRKMEYSAEKGFLLNGVPVKIHGVCLHNDGGALGAACGKETFVRQLEILKTMGCNAVRTAHHPFSPHFLDACDECGILVLAESFDEWQEPIRVMPYSNGEPQYLSVHYYAKMFDQWWKQDLTDMVKRDRNHPSIFAWSVGNEIPQMYKFSGYEIAGKLVECVQNLDSRPVTCAAVVGKLSDQNISLFGIAGFNYPEGTLLDEFHARRPEQPILVTEHFSAQTRRPLGCYLPAGELPPEIAGNAHPQTANFIRRFEQMEPGVTAWTDTAARPFVMGEFIWTGFDYLGEPTPYDYPARSAFFGAIATTGFPKDGYSYYRSVWRDEPLVHIASHWDYPAGSQVDLLVISNCGEVELRLNGKSLGMMQGKDHIFIRRMTFEQGTITAVGYNDGKIAAEVSVHTSGTPAKLELIPEKTAVACGEAAYFRCRLLDDAGRVVRNAALPVIFAASQGQLALDSGAQLSEEPYQKTDRVTLCAGECLCIVRTESPGKLKICAKTAEQICFQAEAETDVL